MSCSSKLDSLLHYRPLIQTQTLEPLFWHFHVDGLFHKSPRAGVGATHPSCLESVT